MLLNTPVRTSFFSAEMLAQTFPLNMNSQKILKRNQGDIPSLNQEYLLIISKCQNNLNFSFRWCLFVIPPSIHMVELPLCLMQYNLTHSLHFHFIIQIILSKSQLIHDNNNLCTNFLLENSYFLQYTKQNRFLYTIRSYTEFDWFSFNGVDGSRTRVQKPIPCPSTSVVYSLTFPPRPGNKHPEHFSSFMLRPYAQSFAYVVSHMFEAGILRCECPRADCCH